MNYCYISKVYINLLTFRIIISVFYKIERFLKETILDNCKIMMSTTQSVTTKSVIQNAFDNAVEKIIHIIIYIIIISLVSILPGWIVMYDLFKVEIVSTPKSLEIFIKTVVAISGGFAVLLTLTLTAIMNARIYDWLYEKNCKLIASLCCHPVIIFCVLVINTGITYVGYIVLYDLCELEIEVKHRFELVVIIITSLLSGWLMLIGIIILITMCCMKPTPQKICICYEKELDDDDDDVIV